MVISARRVSGMLIGGLVVSLLLIWLAHTTDWWVVKVLAFATITMLPGIALLRAMRIILRNPITWLIYAFGLGILILMLSGLLANQLFFALGIDRPLELPWLLAAWICLVSMVIAASNFTNPQQLRLPNWQAPQAWQAWLLLPLCLVLCLGTVFGAFRVNNGASGTLTLATLCYAAILIGYVFIYRRKLPEGWLAGFIFILSLCVLLMTSLRGWDLIGHDIEREFRVYTLTHQHGRWHMGLDKNSYNACLSITILPEVLSKFLHASGLVIFKVVLQVIFAVCVVAIFALLRRYVGKASALGGSLLFICYPTFINDSAMLTRQGIAYLFFALAILVMINHTQRLRFKLLFLLCSLGIVLSHYSTAYMFVALIFFAMLIKFCFLSPATRGKGFAATVLSPGIALVVFLMAYIWYAQLTGTSGGLMVTMQKSFTSIPSLFTEDNRSGDTATALLFAGGQSSASLYSAYMTKTAQQASAVLPAAYTPQLTTDNLPLTALGERLQRWGIEPHLVTSARQNFAKMLQVLAIVSVIYAAYRVYRTKGKELKPDIVCVSAAGLIILALMVVLPILSINYGVLRAFQQELIFLLLPMTMLVVALTRRFRRVARPILATCLAGLFLLFTGVPAQLLGGTSPSLSMNNNGLYYGLYHTSPNDQAAFAWLKERAPAAADVRAANFNRALMHDPSYPFTRSGILPHQVENHSYIYADQAQVTEGKFYVYHAGTPLILTYPLGYLDIHKNQIYSTMTTRVYR